MMMLGRIPWLLLAPVLLFGCAQNDAVPRTRTFPGITSPLFPYAQPEEVGLSREKLNWLGDEIVEWIANGELVGAELLIVKQGKAVFHEAYGWSNREARRPMRRNSIFAVKSMSKSVTATAVLMLVEEGKLALTDPVSAFVSDFAHDSITIHHLLSHTSGFIHDEDEIEFPGGGGYDLTAPGASLREMVETWPHRNPERALGELHFAEFNYAHLGYILEEVTGTTTEAFTHERILGPLGLEDTYTAMSSDASWRERLNAWYWWQPGKGFVLRRSADWPGYTAYHPGWGLFSTAMDYAALMKLWMNGGEWRGVRLLSEATVERALQRHGVVDQEVAFGYGWYVVDVPNAGRTFDLGGGDGTQAIAFQDDDALVIFMTHSRGGTYRAAFWNRLHLSGLFAHPGQGVGFRNMVWAEDTGLTAVDLSPIERARYAGTYARTEQQEDAPEILRIREEAGVMHISMGYGSTAARYHLVPLGDHGFAIGRYDAGRLKGLDPRCTVRFSELDGVIGAVEVIEGDRVYVSAIRTSGVSP